MGRRGAALLDGRRPSLRDGQVRGAGAACRLRPQRRGHRPHASLVLRQRRRRHGRPLRLRLRLRLRRNVRWRLLKCRLPRRSAQRGRRRSGRRRGGRWRDSRRRGGRRRSRLRLRRRLQHPPCRSLLKRRLPRRTARRGRRRGGRRRSRRRLPERRREGQARARRGRVAARAGRLCCAGRGRRTRGARAGAARGVGLRNLPARGVHSDRVRAGTLLPQVWGGTAPAAAVSDPPRLKAGQGRYGLCGCAAASQLRHGHRPQPASHTCRHHCLAGTHPAATRAQKLRPWRRFGHRRWSQTSGAGSAAGCQSGRITVCARHHPIYALCDSGDVRFLHPAPLDARCQLGNGDAWVRGICAPGQERRTAARRSRARCAPGSKAARWWARAAACPGAPSAPPRPARQPGHATTHPLRASAGCPARAP